jgi:hypothetical protein
MTTNHQPPTQENDMANHYNPDATDEAADAQYHAPWCDGSECEATRLALSASFGDIDGECWSHANDDGSADRAAEKWANAWG